MCSLNLLYMPLAVVTMGPAHQPQDGDAPVPDSHLLAHNGVSTACGKRLQLGTAPAEPMTVITEIGCGDCRDIAAAEYRASMKRSLRRLSAVERERILFAVADLLWPEGNENTEVDGGDLYERLAEVMEVAAPSRLLCKPRLVQAPLELLTSSATVPARARL